jgi:hypothetical protein
VTTIQTTNGLGKNASPMRDKRLYNLGSSEPSLSDPEDAIRACVSPQVQSPTNDDHDFSFSPRIATG